MRYQQRRLRLRYRVRVVRARRALVRQGFRRDKADALARIAAALDVPVNPGTGHESHWSAWER